MKQLLVIAFALLSFSLSAQEHHLTFLGIPLTGSITSFAAQLEKKGFRTIEENAEGYALKGMFAGQENSIVAVAGSQKNQVAYAVIVAFPPQATWVETKRDFHYFSKLLKEKYGKPIENIQSFESKSREGKGMEWHEFKCGRATFLQKWGGGLW